MTVLMALVTLSIHHAASACSVCFGDPDSKMVQGAKSGVIVLILVTYGLLMCFGAAMATWFVRARRLSTRPDVESPASPDPLNPEP